jgi:hypothetical protein
VGHANWPFITNPDDADLNRVPSPAIVHSAMPRVSRFVFNQRPSSFSKFPVSDLKVRIQMAALFEC